MKLTASTHVVTVFLLGSCLGLMASQTIFIMSLHDTRLSASVSIQGGSESLTLRKSQDVVSPSVYGVVVGPSSSNNERIANEQDTKRNLPKVTGKHAATPDTLKNVVGTPIINMGMMKAGTTSIFGYFRCGLRKEDDHLLTHYDCNPDVTDRNKIRMSCGKRMRMNVEAYQNPAFHKMDQYLLYAELDAQEQKGGMTIPQYKYIEEIHDQFPNATFILNLRDPKAWIKSIDKWKDLRQRFIDNPLKPDLPKGVGADDADLERFYLAQAQRVRDFVANHPSHQLVEVQIDSPDAGQVMQDHFGITKRCWGTRNVNHDGSAQWDMNPVDPSALKRS